MTHNAVRPPPWLECELLALGLGPAESLRRRHDAAVAVRHRADLSDDAPPPPCRLAFVGTPRHVGHRSTHAADFRGWVVWACQAGGRGGHLDAVAAAFESACMSWWSLIIVLERPAIEGCTLVTACLCRSRHGPTPIMGIG
jgi:hypothetical protein